MSMAERIRRWTVDQETKNAVTHVNAVAGGLQGGELEELRSAMGTVRASAGPASPQLVKGEFVFPSVTPTEFRRRQAAAAAAKARR